MLLVIAAPVVVFGLAAASLGMADVATSPLELSWFFSVLAIPVFAVPALALGRGPLKPLLAWTCIGALGGPGLVALSSMVVWDVLAMALLGDSVLDVPFAVGTWYGPSPPIGLGYAGLGWALQVGGLWLATRRRLALAIGMALAVLGSAAGWMGSSGILRDMPTKPILRAEKFNPFLDHHFHMEVEWAGDVEDAQDLAASRGLEGQAPVWTLAVGDDCQETVEQREHLWVFIAECW